MVILFRSLEISFSFPRNSIWIPGNKPLFRYLEISISLPRNTIAFSRNNISRKRNNVSKECNFIAREQNTYFEVMKLNDYFIGTQ